MNRALRISILVFLVIFLSGWSLYATDSKGLAVSPTSQSSQDLSAGAPSPVGFSVAAPSSLSTVAFPATHKDYLGRSYSEARTAQINPAALLTFLTLMGPEDVFAGDTINITAELTDGNGSPLSGQTISFIVNSVDMGSWTTNSSGMASVTYTVNLSPGTYDNIIMASYAGSGSYAPSSATAGLRVHAHGPTDTHLTIICPYLVYAGDTMTITAMLTDENGSAMSGQTVSFSVNSVDLGSWTTNSSGMASVTYTVNLSPGTYDSIEMVSFAGSGNYAPCSGTGSLMVSGVYLIITTTLPNAQIIYVNGTIYTTDASGNVTILANKRDVYWVSITTPYLVNSASRAVFLNWGDGFTDNPRMADMGVNRTLSAVTKNQYLLIAQAPNGSLSGGTTWYDANSAVSASINYSWGINGTTRSNVVSYSLDGGPNATIPRGGNGTFSVAVNMSSPHTVVCHGVIQYLLSISGGGNVVFGTASSTGDRWYDVGVSTTVSSDYVWNTTSLQSRTRLSSWSLDGSSPIDTPAKDSGSFIASPILMTAGHTVSFFGISQYYVNVVSSEGTVQGSGWFDTGTSASFSVSPTTTPGAPGVQYLFVSWSGSGTGSYSGNSSSTSLKISGPTTETATWKTQYYLNVTTPYGLALGSGWYDSGFSASLNLNPTAAAGGTGAQYVFSTWSGSGTGSYSGSTSLGNIIMNGPISEVATWKTQYYLNVTTPYGLALGSGWYDSGVSASFSTNPTTVAGATGVQYVLAAWSGSGTGSYSGSTSLGNIIMNGPISEVATWTTQFHVTIASPYGTVSGAGWYDKGVVAPFSVSPTSTSASFLTYSVFRGWSGDSTDKSATASITVDSPKTITANWSVDSTQLYLFVIGVIVLVGFLGVLLWRRKSKPKPQG